LVNNISDIRLTKKDRINWSQNINGQTISNYMVNSIAKIGIELPTWKN
jgi:hypothetical protein